MEIAYNTQKIILAQIFIHFFFAILALWRHLYPPKTALFENFEQVLADFSLLLSYNMEFTS